VNIRRGIYLVGANCYIGVCIAIGLIDVIAISLAYWITYINYIVIIIYDVRGRLALARVKNCLNWKY